MAAAHHSLNGLIISANPASSPPAPPTPPASLPLSASLFLSSDRTADGREAPLPFKFQPGAVTCDRHNQDEEDRRKERKKEKKEGGGIKSLSAVMSKASIFTEQLGVSSQRSDVRIHYGSATANCFKVKVTDLTALYFK